MIDVLVAGGGPAGLAAAIRCALAGLSVTVAEPRSGPVDKACGEGLMPAAVQRLAAIGVRPDGRPLRGIRYTDEAHRADALFRGPDGLGVRRTTLHAALAARAAELGIKVLPARVTGLAQDDDGVTATVASARAGTIAGGAAGTIASGGTGTSSGGAATASGRTVTAGGGATTRLRARYLVGADGLHSAIREACGLAPPPARRPRFGLRRHYAMAPWTDLVEVHWTPDAEAYVTPVADDLVGVSVLCARDRTAVSKDGPLSPPLPPSSPHSPPAFLPPDISEISGATAVGAAGGRHIGFEERLAAFPALRERRAGAAPATSVRGAGPLRQDVPRRTAGRVLLAGDASGYIDALTAEGIGAALAQAEALAACLAAGRPGDYERAWRRATRASRLLTSIVLWSRHQPLLAPRIVPAARRLPPVFTTLVNLVARA